LIRFALSAARRAEPEAMTTARGRAQAAIFSNSFFCSVRSVMFR